MCASDRWIRQGGRIIQELWITLGFPVDKWALLWITLSMKPIPSLPRPSFSLDL